MTHRNFLKILSIAAIFLILPLASLIPSAQAAYNFTTVNVPGSDNTRAQDINDAGMIVGHYTSGGKWYGFTLNGTTYTSFDMPGSDSTRFTGINDNGDITGEYSGAATDWSGLKYDGSSWTSFVVPDAARTDPADINNSGHIVGWIRDAAYIVSHGFLYDGSVFYPVDHPGAIGANGTAAFGLNDAGKIVGVYYNGAHHGFIYDGSYSNIDYPGSSYSNATGINNLDQITGNFKIGSGNIKGFLYDSGTWSEIFIPGSTYTFTTGINNNGVITGYYNDGTREYGFISTPVVPSASVIDLPQTGQTACYDETGIEILCVGTGQDGESQTGVIWPVTRFTGDGTGIITDKLTGLQWLEDANCMATHYPSFDSTSEDNSAGDGRVTWQHAMEFVASINAPVFGGPRTNCQAGQSDWRMPNIRELESLVHYGFNEEDCGGSPCTSVAEWLESKGFDNVCNDDYWGSTTYSGAAPEAPVAVWTVYLSGGDYGSYDWNGLGGTRSSLRADPPEPGPCLLTVRGSADSGAGTVDLPKTGDTGGQAADTGCWIRSATSPIGGRCYTAGDTWCAADCNDTASWDAIPYYDAARQDGVTWPDPRFVPPNSNMSGECSLQAGTTCTAPIRTSGDCSQKFCGFQSPATTPCTVNSDCTHLNSKAKCNVTQTCVLDENVVIDELTGLMWTKTGNFRHEINAIEKPAAVDSKTWSLKDAYAFVDYMNTSQSYCSTNVSTTCTNDSDCPGNATVGECSNNSFIRCDVDSDCPVGTCVADGGETCLPSPPNFGYTDWRLPSVREQLSVVNYKDEALDSYLQGEGLADVSGGGTGNCASWTTTNYAPDTTNVYGVSLGGAGYAGATKPVPKTSGFPAFWRCAAPGGQAMRFWPVRSAPAPAPAADISITPSSFDYGDVVQGSDSDVTFTINNIGNGDLSIINIAQSNTIDPPFSLVAGHDNCSGTIVAPAAGCTFDVRFSPIGRGGYNDMFDILSNDPDTSTIFVSVSGTGTSAYLTELPKTGQTTYYSAGDDGDLQMGAAWPTTGNMGTGRFNDNNGDGTVTDLLTGLMWTKNANNGPVNFFSARDAAAALTTGGHMDWRIPNLLELESLTHAGQVDTAAWLNLEGFTGVQATAYWVSSIYVDAGNGGWSLNLGTDQTGYWHTWSTDLMHYWAVRGGGIGFKGEDPDPTYPANVRKTGRTISVTAGDDGDLEWGVAPPAPRFSDNSDGTMTDDFTGLMWTQSASPFSTMGSHGAIHSFADAMGFIDAINAGDSVCRVDPAQRKQCFPWSGRPVIPQTLCPADYSCVGATLNPDTYGECYGPGLTYCNDAADCNAAENEECAQLDNHNYTDWRMANKKEMYSLVHMDSDGTANDEFATDELAAAGFIVPNFAWCSHWTSTADPADPMNKVFGVSLNTGGFQMLTHSLVDASAPFGCNWTYVPQFVWPVRTAPAPAVKPDISISPSSYDFGNVAVGVTSSTVFTVENLGSGDLDITSVSIPSSYFNIQSEDCTTPPPLAQNDSCSISVDFTPSAPGAASEDLLIASNDPDTPALTAGLTGTGIPAVIDLELSKTVDNPTPVEGGTVLFTVAVTNSGPSDATGVSVEDVVPSGFSNIRNINFGGTESGGTITWSSLSINNGITRNLRFTADVDPGGSYTNISQVTAADQPDSDSTPNNDDGDQSEDDEDSEIVSPTMGIDLELSKSVSNSSPDVGSTVTFSIDVTNNGYLDATGVSVKDVVPDGYSNIQNISHGGTENAIAAVQYIITDLGITPFSSSPTRFDINDSGQVVGNYDVGGGLRNGFFWENGSLTDLGVLSGGSYSEAIGINNNNQAVGFATNSSGDERAVLWEFNGDSWGAAQDLGTYGGNQGWAENINDAGLVSGHATYPGSTNAHATIWNTNVTGFPKTNLPGEFFNYGGGINSAGHVVSTSYQGSNWIAYYYNGISMQNMGTLGGTKAVGYDINDNNQATGFSSIPSGQNRAFLWTSGGGMQNLGVLSGDISSAASGINNSAQVVGSSYDASGEQHAFLWDSVNGMQDLNDLVINGTGWVLQHTADINESGAIVGYGTFNGQDRAFVLNVVTEAGGTITWSGLSINNSAAVNLTFDADVNVSGNYTNVAQVTAADQTDIDSTPNNDNGDQSEDDEDSASVIPVGCANPTVKNMDTLAEFCSIQEAYIAAGNNEAIRSQAIIYTESLDFNDFNIINKTVLLLGGYDDTYTTVIGNTILNGNVTSTAGSVTMGNFILQ